MKTQKNMLSCLFALPFSHLAFSGPEFGWGGDGTPTGADGNDDSGEDGGAGGAEGQDTFD